MNNITMNVTPQQLFGTLILISLIGLYLGIRAAIRTYRWENQPRLCKMLTKGDDGILRVEKRKPRVLKSVLPWSRRELAYMTKKD